MTTLKGSTAIVTGVGRLGGIGAAACRALAKEGVDIFFTYWHPYDIEQYQEREDISTVLTKELVECGVHTGCVELDLSLPDSPKELFVSAVKHLRSPDILINNAAVSTQQPFTAVTTEILDQHYALNVRATTLLCKEFLFAVDEERGGKILNLTSGQDLGVMEGELPYTITKAAVNMLTKQLAPELLKKKIVINAFDPGPTDTGWMTDEIREQIRRDSKTRKVNTPKDTAKAIIELLKDESGVTGQVIHAER